MLEKIESIQQFLMSFSLLIFWFVVNI